jgi:hypothetical protein
MLVRRSGERILEDPSRIPLATRLPRNPADDPTYRQSKSDPFHGHALVFNYIQ